MNMLNSLQATDWRVYILRQAANMQYSLAKATIRLLSKLLLLFSISFCSVWSYGVLAQDFDAIYKASLAIDQIRNVRYHNDYIAILFPRNDPSLPAHNASTTDELETTLAGQNVANVLTSQSRTGAPQWNHASLLNGRTQTYQMLVRRDHGFNNLNYSIFSDDATLYVVLWGTTDENWQGNQALSVLNPAYDGANTHAGWASMAYDNYATITTEMTRQNAASKQVIITGHSQGAAVAGHLTYLMLKNEYLNDSQAHRLVNFGGPRYSFVKEFGNFFDRYVTENAPRMEVATVEIREDEIIYKWAWPGYGRLGEPVFRPLHWAANNDTPPVIVDEATPHNHLNYVWLAHRLNSPVTTSRPEMDVQNLPELMSTRLCEPEDSIIASWGADPANPDKINIVLKALPNITWWKGLKIYENGVELKELYTKDKRLEDSYLVAFDPRNSYEIEFGKAKTFGVPTWIKKHSIDLNQFNSGTIIFHWLAD